MTHTFRDDLDWSNRPSANASWELFWRCRYPQLRGTLRVPKNALFLQRMGVDRILLLPNQRRLFVDEKERRTGYDDVAVELWSVIPDGSERADWTPGWSWDKKKTNDLVGYAIPKIGKVYVFDADLLRQVVRRLGKVWSDEYGETDSRKGNRNYITRCVCVPLDRLLVDLGRAECVGNWPLVTS